MTEPVPDPSAPGADLQSSLLTSLDELEALRDEWSALLSRSDSNEPMLSPTWLIHWWRGYGKVGDRHLCSMTFRRAGELVGFAPLCRRRVMDMRVPMQRIELLGSGETEADETCSEYIGILAARGCEQAVANAFGEALHAGDLGPWDECLLTALSSESVMPPLLARALGRATRYQVLGGAPFAELPDSWEAYLAALPSSRRYLIRRSLKAWEKWAKEPPTLKWVEKEEELELAFETLSRLHEERWQKQGKSGAFSSELFSEFHRQVMRELFREGALWLCWLEFAGEPVASIYNIVWNQQVRFYQSGRKVDLPKKVRAGLVIHACAIREAISRGYTQYDFLAGTTRYKMQLSSNVRPLVQLSLRRPSMRARLLDLGNTGKLVSRNLRDEWRRRFSGATVLPGNSRSTTLRS